MRLCVLLPLGSDAWRLLLCYKNVGIDTYLALAQQLGVELQIKPIERIKGAE